MSSLTSTSTLVVLTREQVAARCAVDVALIEELVSLGVIDPMPDGSSREVTFSCEVTLRVGRFVRLQRDLGVNLEGASVIVELLDRIDALEHELQALRRR